MFRLCLVNGTLDESRTLEVILLAATAGRRNSQLILSHLLRLVRLDLARHTASVESAAPLPAELRADIESTLRQRYGSELATTFDHRPVLIGGVRIQVGSDVYDASVLAGLAALEKSFEAR